MNMKDRLVTIYLPDGSIKNYTTSKDVVDIEIELAESIVCEPHEVNVVLKDIDGSLDGYAFVGMPYVLNMF